MLKRFESALDAAVEAMLATGVPPRLAKALRYALFSGGGRIRPLLCLEIANACGDTNPALADAAAVAVEMIHCGSLAQDDLPAFDASDMRRGQAAVHREFGEALGILVGDGLIVSAFAHLAEAGRAHPEALPAMIGSLARGTGIGGGIIAGQAWESEPEPDLDTYHRAKTGALFSSAAELGALAAGCSGDGWRRFGRRLGAAYQLADDIADATGCLGRLGKPSGRDGLLDRPNAVASLGLEAAREALEAGITEAQDAIPACPHRDDLAAQVRAWARRLAPGSRSRSTQEPDS